MFTARYGLYHYILRSLNSIFKDVSTYSLGQTSKAVLHLKISNFLFFSIIKIALLSFTPKVKFHSDKKKRTEKIIVIFGVEKGKIRYLTL